MRISDWSSDLCSSDLPVSRPVVITVAQSAGDGNAAFARAAELKPDKAEARDHQRPHLRFGDRRDLRTDDEVVIIRIAADRVVKAEHAPVGIERPAGESGRQEDREL